MFYYISKVFWIFAVPSNFLVALVLIGALLRSSRFPRAGQRMVLGGLFGLIVLGLTPISTWLLRPLENEFPIFQDDGRPVTGIIILGGATETVPSTYRKQMSLTESGERIMAIPVLAQRYPNARIIFSGGGSGFNDQITPEATLVERLATDIGIAPGRIEYERRSLNTYENALYSREIAKPRPGERWLLVTSAFHMPRAMGVFRHLGFAVTPYPVDFRTGGSSDDWQVFTSVSQGLLRSELALKEYVGLIAYRLSGKTDVVFPARDDSASP